MCVSQDQLPQQLRYELKTAGIPLEAVSLYAVNLEKNQLLLDVNSKEPRNPASVMKLVTTLSALEILGPNFHWKTEISYRGQLKESTLFGDLIVKGFGDPSLTLEQFWILLNKIRSRGIQKIKGNVIIDRSFFDIPYHNPSEFDGKPFRPYNLGPDAFLVNFNSIKVTIVPDKKNKNIKIYSMPTFKNIKIKNKLKWSTRSCWSWPDTPKLVKENVVFEGLYSSKCGVKQRYYSMLSPDLYTAEIFKKIWKQLGGSIEGQILNGIKNSSDSFLLDHRSFPLTHILRTLNKHSNNVTARHIFLTLAYEQNNGKSVSTEKARAKISTWLKSIGLSPSEIIVENGSGLSRISRISAYQIGMILQRAWDSPLMPEFISSLPIIATDGTMRMRMRNTDLKGMGHMKTGYLKGTRTIAGFLKNKKKETLLVVCFINHPKAKNSWPIHKKLLTWLYERT